MFQKENQLREKAVLAVAEKMALAARTAPKACGLDLLEIAILSGEDIKKLSGKMKEIGEREDNRTLKRDCENVLSAQAVVLIGTQYKTVGVKYCGFCGKKNCAEAEKTGTTCVFNAGDLGIAIGSAVSIAMDNRIDNRIMYSIGVAAGEMGLLGSEIKLIYGIPLSVSGKNPFFDRK